MENSPSDRQKKRTRVFLPGAGGTELPIDVEEWEDSEPIDVDALDEHSTSSNVRESPRPRYVPVQSTSTAQLSASATPAGHAFECCICKNTLLKPVVTFCIHFYCDHCLRRNLNYSFVCPQCRRTITSPPMRDMLLETALAAAIERGEVPKPMQKGRAAAYVWHGVRFPAS
ncbi:hypothetical protein B0H11DRAFT_2245897 [Mycena galericulata]|nr:hypothetical protein B0H11DRAFT_2245897 [Mycena galericulata]